MLVSSNIYTLFFCDSLFDDEWERLWYILVMTLGYIVGLLLFRFRTFFIITGIMQISVLPIEICSLYLNHQPVSMPFMHWIISTNRRESLELLSSVWWLVLAVFLMWGIYWWLVSCLSKEIKVQIRNRWVMIGTLVAMAFSLLLIHFAQLNKNYTAPNKHVYARIYAWSFGMHVGNVFPYDIYLQTFRAYKHMREIDGIAALTDYHFGITPHNDTDSALYVLVIGEAARYHNFSLNGKYERETNPLLTRQSNVVFYNNAYAEANATDLSVPLMITRATAKDPLTAYNEKTIVGAFQEANYNVAWLSAESFPIRYLQYVFPTMDTVWIASEGSAFDEILFKPFQDIINSEYGLCNSNSLIVLHTKGSHLNYQDRYPEEFSKFQPCIKQGASNGTFEKELMTNTYDNSILYTDYILHSLIQKIDSAHRCACLIYMPDHGENLSDDERKLWVHGSYEGSEWEYHVPLLVWYSQLFQEKYPNKVKALIANKDKQVTSQVLFYTLCDMANLHEIEDGRYSLFSDSLEEVTSICVLNGKGEIITIL